MQCSVLGHHHMLLTNADTTADMVKGATLAVPEHFRAPVDSAPSSARHAFDNATEGLPVTYAPFVQVSTCMRGMGLLM